VIKINLCPLDELESPYWYVPDFVVAAVVGLVGFFGANYYLGTIQAEIDLANDDIASLEASIKDLEPDIARFKGLGVSIRQLENKLTALKEITVSKISRYRPVIILEHLQNLKPEGVWYTNVRVGDAGGGGGPVDEFEISGGAFDNILTAELLTALRSTATQEPDESDLRTLVYFGFLGLDDSRIEDVSTPETDGPPVSGSATALARFPRFVMRGRYLERSVATPLPPPSALRDESPETPPPEETGKPVAKGAGRATKTF
jgi:hypothetical protein